MAYVLYPTTCKLFRVVFLLLCRLYIIHRSLSQQFFYDFFGFFDNKPLIVFLASKFLLTERPKKISISRDFSRNSTYICSKAILFVYFMIAWVHSFMSLQQQYNDKVDCFGHCFGNLMRFLENEFWVAKPPPVNQTYFPPKLPAALLYQDLNPQRFFIKAYFISFKLNLVLPSESWKMQDAKKYPMKEFSMFKHTSPQDDRQYFFHEDLNPLPYIGKNLIFKF